MVVTTAKTLEATDFHVPEILLRRSLPEEYQGQRYLDDEEVLISSVLDNYGKISSSEKLQDFMVILTRIERVSIVTEQP